MTGLFAEVGPFTAYSHFTEFKLNNESWNKEHSLLFIDNPVGAGFSFTNSSQGYAHFTNTSSIQLYEAVQQFLQMFPELRQAPLFITGESYAGKYIPGLAMEIHRNKNHKEPINLQGLAIGNGFIDPMGIVEYSKIAYHHGIVDLDGRKELEELEEGYKKFFYAGDTIKMRKFWANILVTLSVMVHKSQLYNIFKEENSFLGNRYHFKSLEIRKAIHVGSLPFDLVNMTVNTEMNPDFSTNYRPVMEQLLEHYRVLLYSGQLDLMVPYVLSSENVRTWMWRGKEDFVQSARHPLLINNKIAGFHKSGGNLTEVLVWNAGHMVPQDQPAVARLLIERFTSNNSLPGRVEYRKLAMYRELIEKGFTYSGLL